MFSKSKYLTLWDRFALTMIAASIVVTLVFQILSIHQKTRTSSPIPNTTMDSDGVIRLNPQNGCGPFAHVENHPVYGQLCVQNEGSWKVAIDSATVEKSPPCVSDGGSSAASSGIALSCQSISAWPSHR